MCEFFSFVQTQDNKFYYLDDLFRDANPGESADSYSLICKVYSLREDLVNKFEYSKGILKEDYKAFDYIQEDVQAWIDNLVSSPKFERICLSVLKQDGYAIRYIQHQTPELCKILLNKIYLL
jgi:hypothetical protein